jgi:hypothetical protein
LLLLLLPESDEKVSAGRKGKEKETPLAPKRKRKIYPKKEK